MTVNSMKVGNTTCHSLILWHCLPSMKAALRIVGTISVKLIMVLVTPAAAQPWPLKVRHPKLLSSPLIGFFFGNVMSSKITRLPMGICLQFLELVFVNCYFLHYHTVIRSHQSFLMILDSKILFFLFSKQIFSSFIFFFSGSTSCFHPEACSNRSS